MRSPACLALVLAACQGGGGDDYQVIPQGDDGISMPMIDAPMADSSTDAIGGMINGRVCLMADWRTPTMGCSTTGAAGITVVLGTSSATTNVDGAFSISAPVGAGLVWRVGAADVVKTVMPFGTDHTIPAMLGAVYEDFLLDNGVILDVTRASIFLRVIRGGAPLPGVTGSPNPPAQYLPFYDGNSASVWDQDVTGVRGMVWIAGAPGGGPTTVSLLAPGASSTVPVTVPVDESAITYATVEIP